MIGSTEWKGAGRLAEQLLGQQLCSFLVARQLGKLLGLVAQSGESERAVPKETIDAALFSL